jgi:hypothetical protein
VLQALAARNLDRALGQIRVVLTDTKHDSWVSAMSAAFDVFVDAFRTEPGFRSLRVGDVIDLRPAPTPTTYNSKIVEEMLRVLAERFEIDDTPEAQLAFETAIEVTDALVARAFARDVAGDPAFLEQARTVVRLILEGYFPEKVS